MYVDWFVEVVHFVEMFFGVGIDFYVEVGIFVVVFGCGVGLFDFYDGLFDWIFRDELEDVEDENCDFEKSGDYE